MKTYKDKVSGETLYVVPDQGPWSDQGITRYYKDKAMTIRHRRDGPAVEYADGRKVWCVDDVIITFITSNGKYKGSILLQDKLQGL